MRQELTAQELSSENCLVVPPVALSLQKAMATLVHVVPLWPSSSFWPLLTSKYRLFIQGCFTLNASQALTLGRNLLKVHSLVLLVLQARLSRLDSNFYRVAF